MRTITKNLVIVIMSLVACSLQAKVIYVDGFANNGGDGSNWEKAFTSIGAALAEAVSGDEIWVASDTYTGQYIMKSGVSVYGGFDATETSRDQRDWIKNRTILKNNDGLVLKNQNGLTEDAYFDGFDITGRTTSGNGGGGYLSPKMHLKNCRILNCVSEKGTGGGIALDHGASVENCIFAGNSSQSTGGGLNMNKGGVAKNCIFINNFSRGNSGGGLAASASADGAIYATVINCLFANNEAYSNGGGMWTQGALVVNCTFVNNKTQRTDAQGNGGGISLDGLANATDGLLRGGEMYNSVLWGNAINKDNKDRKQIFIPAQSATDDKPAFHRGKLSNCAIQDLADITELSEYHDSIINISTQLNLSAVNEDGAKFINPSAIVGLIETFDPISYASTFNLSTYSYNWGLQPTSLLIDAGDNTKNSTTVDLAGNPRIYNSTIDLGAYEYAVTSALNNPKSNKLICYLANGKIHFSSQNIRFAKIYSISGILVKDLNVRGGSANISDLTNGTYLIVADGITQKIIK